MVHSVDLTCLVRSSRDGHQCGFVGPSAQTSRMSHADLGGQALQGRWTGWALGPAGPEEGRTAGLDVTIGGRKPGVCWDR